MRQLKPTPPRVNEMARRKRTGCKACDDWGERGPCPHRNDIGNQAAPYRDYPNRCYTLFCLGVGMMVLSALIRSDWPYSWLFYIPAGAVLVVAVLVIWDMTFGTVRSVPILAKVPRMPTPPEPEMPDFVNDAGHILFPPHYPGQRGEPGAGDAWHRKTARRRAMPRIHYPPPGPSLNAFVEYGIPQGWQPPRPAAARAKK